MTSKRMNVSIPPDLYKEIQENRHKLGNLSKIATAGFRAALIELDTKVMEEARLQQDLTQLMVLGCLARPNEETNNGQR